jgi:hypothetical protein
MVVVYPLARWIVAREYRPKKRDLRGYPRHLRNSAKMPTLAANLLATLGASEVCCAAQ